MYLLVISGFANIAEVKFCTVSAECTTIHGHILANTLKPYTKGHWILGKTFSMWTCFCHNIFWRSMFPIQAILWHNQICHILVTTAQTVLCQQILALMSRRQKTKEREQRRSRRMWLLIDFRLRVPKTYMRKNKELNMKQRKRSQLLQWVKHMNV